MTDKLITPLDIYWNMPIVLVEIIPIINKELSQTFKSNPLRALIDTGSFHSLINKRVLEWMKTSADLKPVTDNLNHEHIIRGKSSFEGYEFGVNFTGLNDIWYRTALGNEIEGDQIDIIIGTSFLKTFNFHYKGYDNVFELEFNDSPK